MSDEHKVETLTKEQLEALSIPFPPEAIQWKPGATTRDKKKALALAYVSLRYYIDRLNEVVGPTWSDEYTVQEGGTVVVCRLTIAGVLRSDVGEAPSSDQNTATIALAQAFKRACVKFGLGAHLYKMPQQWVEFDAQKKRISPAGLAKLTRSLSYDAPPPQPPKPEKPMTLEETLTAMDSWDDFYPLAVERLGYEDNKAVMTAVKTVLDGDKAALVSTPFTDIWALIKAHKESGQTELPPM